ncbi:hypothetical protein [Rhodoblastus sp.]|uniref:hypothetical protein n=1 Tax=Rhodoblastus sp. TaxID=1962975 RepID=UPI003F999715
MKNSVKLAAAVLAMALASGSASAKVWEFSYTDGVGDSGSGTFITGSVGPTYTVTGITGTADGKTITGLSSYAGSDQILYPIDYPKSAGVDLSGISFSTSGGPDFNLYAYSGGTWLLNSNVDPIGYPQNGNALTAFSVSTVPEVSTWLMMLAGFAGLGFVGYRRQKAGFAA